MKKLMIIAVIAMTGVMARAAQVDWYAYAASLPTEGTAYVFNGGDTAASLASYLTSGTYEDASAFTSAIASYSGVALDGGYADGTLLDVGDTISCLVVGSLAEGSSVYLASGVSTDGYVYTPPQSADLVGIESFSTGVIKFKDDPGPGPGPEPVPEPTSGLLLLLGVAGLALRRRRA